LIVNSLFFIVYPQSLFTLSQGLAPPLHVFQVDKATGKNPDWLKFYFTLYKRSLNLPPMVKS